ncbi:hypothetical protein HanPI659440_Chr10g0389941 [Helianthus annuus]|nr:hypothetical protein HanPI659440_Chr10g0389941 [Helianthus annuus]
MGTTKREGAKRKEDTARKAGGKLVHFDGSKGFTADDLLRASVEMTSKSTYGFNYKATLVNGDELMKFQFKHGVNILLKMENMKLN